MLRFKLSRQGSRTGVPVRCQNVAEMESSPHAWTSLCRVAVLRTRSRRISAGVRPLADGRPPAPPWRSEGLQAAASARARRPVQRSDATPGQRNRFGDRTPRPSDADLAVMLRAPGRLPQNTQRPLRATRVGRHRGGRRGVRTAGVRSAEDQTGTSRRPRPARRRPPPGAAPAAPSRPPATPARRPDHPAAGGAPPASVRTPETTDGHVVCWRARSRHHPPDDDRTVMLPAGATATGVDDRTVMLPAARRRGFRRPHRHALPGATPLRSPGDWRRPHGDAAVRRLARDAGRCHAGARHDVAGHAPHGGPGRAATPFARA